MGDVLRVELGWARIGWVGAGCGKEDRVGDAGTELVVRAYEGRDEEGVVALWHECGLVVPWNDPGEDIARKLAVQRQLFLVAAVADRVVGTVMAGYEGHRGWINYLAVAPDCRGEGIGRRMMAAAEDGLRALGCPKINLQVRSGTRALWLSTSVWGSRVTRW